MRQDAPPADVCLILEGSYPFITGGVSSWTHDLIRAQTDLRFHIVALTADDVPRGLQSPDHSALREFIAPVRQLDMFAVAESALHGEL